jgi:hypothetical protein
VHSGKFDNSIGTKPTMRRNEVNENDYETCSTGLHFCSYGYLSSFGSTGNDRVVVVKVDPKDVVSIPVDYQDMKARACAYEVVEEVVNYQEEDTLRNSRAYNSDDDFDDMEQYGDGDCCDGCDCEEDGDVDVFGYLNTLTNRELASLYNEWMVEKGLPMIDHFRDKATGIRRILSTVPEWFIEDYIH